MNTAAMICDNTYTVVSRESAGGDRGPLGPMEDRPQQRFADVLPLAQAKLEPPAHDAGRDRAPAKDESSGSERRKDAAPVDSPREDAETVCAPCAVSAEAQSLASLQGRHLTDPAVLSTQGQGKTRGATQARTKGPITEATVPVERPGIRGPHASDSRTARSLAGGDMGAQRGVQATHGPAHRSAGSLAESPLTGPTTGVKARKASEIAAPAKLAGKSALPAGPESPAQVARTGSKDATGGQTTVKNAGEHGTPGARSAHPASQTGGPDAQAGVKASAAAPPESNGDKAAQVSSHGAAPSSPQAKNAASGGSSPPAQAGLEVPGEHAMRASGSLSSTTSQEGAGKEETGSRTRNTASGAAMVSSSQESAANVRQNGRAKDTETRLGESPQNSPRTADPVHGSPAAELGEQGGKETQSAVSKEGGFALSGPSILPRAESASSAPRATMQMSNQTGLDVPVARTPAQSVGEQILDSVHAAVSRGDRQVLVRLNPPELGTVVVRFQEQGEQVSAMLEVGNREVRREIEQALPQVARSLQEAGVQVRRLEVVASDQPERDPSREQLLQDPWSQQQQGSGQNREHLHASPQARWSQGATGRFAGREDLVEDESHASIPRGRIDMLL